MSEDFYDKCTRIMGEGEAAGNFSPYIKVWSEFAVRAVILRTLKDYEQHRIKNTPAPQNGWLSVEDGLPECRCIAYTPDQSEGMVYRIIPKGLFKQVATDATHWMPLPSSPLNA